MRLLSDSSAGDKMSQCRGRGIAQEVGAGVSWHPRQESIQGQRNSKPRQGDVCLSLLIHAQILATPEI